MGVRYFEELEVWKEARRLTKEIYNLTRNPSFSKDTGLIDQIRRASLSIISNIAEGFERGSNQEFLQFLYIAKGSCGEVRAKLYVAFDQGYVNEEKFIELIKLSKRISIMLSNLIESIRKSGLRGEKFKPVKRKSIQEEVEDTVKELGIDIKGGEK